MAMGVWERHRFMEILREWKVYKQTHKPEVTTDGKYGVPHAY